MSTTTAQAPMNWVSKRLRCSRASREEGDDIDRYQCDDMHSDAGGDELAGGSAEIQVENDGTVCRQIITGSWDAGAAELVEDSTEDLTLPSRRRLALRVQLGESCI